MPAVQPALQIDAPAGIRYPNTRRANLTGATPGEAAMDFTTILGIIALAISTVSLWRGWRSEADIKKRFDDFNRANERQANQIDALIEVVRLMVARL